MQMRKILNITFYSCITSQLELNPVAVVFDLQFRHLIVDNCFDKCLDSELEVSGGQQNVLPDVLMCAGIPFKEGLKWFSINQTFLKTGNIDVGDMMFSQEGSEVLGIPDIVTIDNNMLH